MRSLSNQISISSSQNLHCLLPEPLLRQAKSAVPFSCTLETRLNLNHSRLAGLNIECVLGDPAKYICEIDPLASTRDSSNAASRSVHDG